LKRFEQLKSNAKKVSKSLGHSIGRFKTTTLRNKNRKGYAKCITCGSFAYVDESVQNNEKALHGDAIESECLHPVRD
jgi:hypothetical protein